MENHEIRKIVNKKLLEVGVPPHIKGFGYIIDAVTLCNSDAEYLSGITTRLYPGIAKIRNTSASRVERAIRHAVEVCFDRATPETISEHFGNALNPFSGKATNSQFIATIVNELQIENGL